MKVFLKLHLSYYIQNLHWKLGQQTPSAGTFLAYLQFHEILFSTDAENFSRSLKMGQESSNQMVLCCSNFLGRFWSYLYRPNRHYGLMLLFRAREEYDKASQLSNFRRSRDASMNHLRESTMEKFRGIEERESEWVQTAIRYFLCIYVFARYCLEFLAVRCMW